MRSLREGASERVATAVGIIKRTRGRCAAPIASLCLASAAALCIVPATAQGQAPPPDEHWATIETPHFRVTFPRRLEALGRRAGARAERAYGELADAFVQPPSGRIDVLLTDHEDISNGYAQVLPSNRITIFARPPADDLGLGYFDEWIELVTTHELTHIFHLDRTGRLGRLLRGMFGRVPAPWPFFPNTGVPRWTTEGLATWYESYFTNAGRVEGTYHEMIVRTAEIEGDFPGLGQASGDSPIWPGGTLAYAYGSLFFDHLLEKYGEEKMGAFAEAVAGQWVPYRLNAAAKKAFGHSLGEEWGAWEEEVAARADSLRSARAERTSPPEPERLTHGGRVALYPRVSPDGRTLAWARADGTSEVQIHASGLDGRGGRQATRTNGVATFDWAPDGALVFSQLELDGPYRAYDDLYVLGRDDDVRRLTQGARLSQPSVAPGGGWAVAVRDTLGTNVLVRVDLASGATTPVAAPDLDVHWAYPSVSPDGRWIAVSRWTPGARLDLVVLDAATGGVAVRVTDDRALDLAPAWSPDGRWVLWTSDRSGIPNILAATVDPVSGRAGEPRAVTDVLTGAAYATVEPGGRWVYFSGYHATGWDVERTSWAPDAWPAAPTVASRFDAPPRPAAVQEAAAAGPVKGYSPFPTLLPTYWEPLLSAPARANGVRLGDLVVPSRDVIGPGVGLQTGGFDLVGRHSWQALARVSTGTHAGLFDGAASYSYRGLGNPLLSIGGSQFWDDDGVRLARETEGAPIDVLFVLLRQRNASAAVTFLGQRWRRAMSLTLSGGMAWEHRELLDNALEPSTVYHFQRPDSRFADLRATLAYSTLRSFGYQMGAAAGSSLLIRARHKAELGVPDTLSDQPGQDRSLDEVIGQLRAFQPLGGPGYASHVFGVRVSGGAARGPGADADYFEVGGASGATETVTGLALFGGSSVFFPVRGYPKASRAGRYAWSATGEYRFPLGVLNRGPGLLPIEFDRVLGDLFFDAGNAWGPELGIPGFQNPRGATLASAGAEVVTGLLAFWTVPMDVRAGAAVPLVEGNGAVFYVRLGLSF